MLQQTLYETATSCERVTKQNLKYWEGLGFFWN